MTHHSKKNSKYGWKPDIADSRDRVLTVGVPKNLSTIPNQIDLRGKCSTVENQSTLGSCTANSVVGALEYLEILDESMETDCENFSRLFVYYNTREIEGNIEVDSGASLRSTIQALATHGTCDERLWDYDINKFKIKPLANCYEAAKTHKITEYARLNSLPDMLACLAAGFPFVFGFSVYTEFEGPNVAKTGILELPKPNETFLGGHAVCAVGYNISDGQLLVRNSWGEGWGQNGYFKMPFSYISNPNLAADAWTIRK